MSLLFGDGLNNNDDTEDAFVLEPPATNKTNKPHKRSPTPSLLPGVKVTRRVIFRDSVTSSSWHLRMLQAIATAKDLGVTQFEINAPSSEELTALFSAGNFFSQNNGYPPIEGDEWRREADKTSCTVIVYAITIDND